jgi:hypothetical protein
LRGALTGGGARRTGEAELDGVSDDPVVGTRLAGECDRGETAWPPGNSGVSSLRASNKLPRSKDFIEYESCYMEVETSGIS